MYSSDFSFFDKAAAEKFVGREVLDQRGERIGVMAAFWLDPSTFRVAYIGVTPLIVADHTSARSTEHRHRKYVALYHRLCSDRKDDDGGRPETCSISRLMDANAEL